MGLLGRWLFFMKEIEKRAQLKSGDVGPASAQLHVLKELEQGTSLRRQTGSEGTVLNGAMKMLKVAEKGQKQLWFIAVISGDRSDLREQWLDLRIQSGHF